jgi:hypothetical protein
MKAKLRKIVAVSLLVMSICFTTEAFADESQSEGTLLTRDKAIELADQFAQSASGIDGIVVYDSRNIFDTSGECVGALVSYSANGEPAGYLVIDKNAEGAIGSFSFSNGSTGPFESVTENFGKSSLLSAEEGRLVQLNPMTYCVAYDSKGWGVTTEGELLKLDSEGIESPEEAGVSARMSWFDCFIDVKQLMVRIDAERKYGPFKAINQFYTMTTTKSYACAVTAMFECSLAYGTSVENELTSHYSYLWQLSGTSAYGNDSITGATLGSTRGDKIGPTFTKFAADHGRKISYVFKSLPSFQDFKDVINRGDVAIYNGMLTDGNQHAMAVEGWAELSVPGAGISYQTLFVANGYDIQGSFFNMYHSSIKSDSAVLFDA